VANVRVVADTNIYVSALLWTGVPHRLLRLAEAEELTLVTTPSIMEELARRGARAAKIPTETQKSSDFGCGTDGVAHQRGGGNS
jgi:predicted nucleic acid-binding protein